MIVQIIGWFALVIFVLGLIAGFKDPDPNVHKGRNLALLLIVAAICFK